MLLAKFKVHPCIVVLWPSDSCWCAFFLHTPSTSPSGWEWSFRVRFMRNLWQWIQGTLQGRCLPSTPTAKAGPKWRHSQGLHYGSIRMSGHWSFLRGWSPCCMQHHALQVVVIWHDTMLCRSRTTLSFPFMSLRYSVRNLRRRKTKNRRKLRSGKWPLHYVPPKLQDSWHTCTQFGMQSKAHHCTIVVWCEHNPFNTIHEYACTCVCILFTL